MVTQITAGELRGRLAGDDPPTLVDTRTPESFEQWHIRGAKNIPFDPAKGFDAEHAAAVDEMAAGESVSVICGKGLTSTPFGIHLEGHGHDDVSVVKGGMEDWSELHDVATWRSGPVIIHQVQRRATGCLSYVIASRDSGVAIVVDPTRQTHQFTSLIACERLSVAAVIDTHLHADHLSGGPRLADELGVPYRLGAVESDDHEYDHVDDGETIDLDGVTITIHHAPGHTEEMANLAVNDAFVLSSDSLLLDGVGRTELGFEDGNADRGAERLYETIHGVILEQPPEAILLPGHVSISADTQFNTGTPGERIGRRLSQVAEERERIGVDRGRFVEAVTEDLPEKPSNYEAVIAVNAGKQSVENESTAADLDTGPNNCSA